MLLCCRAKSCVQPVRSSFEGLVVGVGRLAEDCWMPIRLRPSTRVTTPDPSSTGGSSVTTNRNRSASHLPLANAGDIDDSPREPRGCWVLEEDGWWKEWVDRDLILGPRGLVRQILHASMLPIPLRETTGPSRRTANESPLRERQVRRVVFTIPDTVLECFS